MRRKWLYDTLIDSKFHVKYIFTKYLTNSISFPENYRKVNFDEVGYFRSFASLILFHKKSTNVPSDGKIIKVIDNAFDHGVHGLLIVIRSTWS